MAETAMRKRVSAKDPETKLAHRRLTVLELAQTLGNVTEACRQGGIDRCSFYEWKRRFQLQGLEGLKDLPPIVIKALISRPGAPGCVQIAPKAGWRQALPALGLPETDPLGNAA